MQCNILQMVTVYVATGSEREGGRREEEREGGKGKKRQGEDGSNGEKEGAW